MSVAKRVSEEMGVELGQEVRETGKDRRQQLKQPGYSQGMSGP